MGIGDKIRDTAEDIKDKAGAAVSGVQHKARAATAGVPKDPDNGNAPDSGFGVEGHAAAHSVDPGEPPGRTSESRNPTVQSDKIQGL